MLSLVTRDVPSPLDSCSQRRQEQARKENPGVTDVDLGLAGHIPISSAYIHGRHVTNVVIAVPLKVCKRDDEKASQKKK
ncbi:hypothetical protein JOB18_002930 [Solea senegalensis]|uniref:Uncharacterized protein n=1 Tax=Solea senegalensis TaxID=28829 RepID=A0AAV6SEI3_SOLSE|nr:hypothetical protein JOB18_002930 [Solea senegalensis]